MDLNGDNDYLLAALGVVLCGYAALKMTRRRTRRFKTRPINRTHRATGNYSYYQKMKTGTLSRNKASH
nr:unnamed protein product [Callosobruchus chinensis]